MTLPAILNVRNRPFSRSVRSERAVIPPSGKASAAARSSVSGVVGSVIGDFQQHVGVARLIKCAPTSKIFAAEFGFELWPYGLVEA